MFLHYNKILSAILAMYIGQRLKRDFHSEVCVCVRVLLGCVGFSVAADSRIAHKNA